MQNDENGEGPSNRPRQKSSAQYVIQQLQEELELYKEKYEKIKYDYQNMKR